MTTIYFVRHSKPMNVKSINYMEHLQLKNEKAILSVKGEQRARVLSELGELADIDCIISSNYVRAMSTAKYIANRNNLDLLIEEDFRERKQGVNAYSELGEDYFIRQHNEEDYKLGNGESQKEVKERMYNALLDILRQFKDKRVAIVSHGTALTFLFMKWCNIEMIGDAYKMSFNNKVFFEKEWNTPELFKLVFNDNNNLTHIENIRLKELENI